MKGILLEVPAEVVAATRLPYEEIEEEYRKELALALYQRGLVPASKAGLVARMTRWEFEMLLAERQIPRHYSETDLDEDLEYALGNQ